MPALNLIGQKVKRARLEHKPPLTQEMLAVQLQFLGWEIDRFGISKIERQERQVTDKELVMLSQVLGIKVGKLLGEN